MSTLKPGVPKKHLPGLLIAAWCLLGLAILISITGLMLMIWLSLQFQRELRRALKEEDAADAGMVLYTPGYYYHRFSSTEYFSGVLFILGVLLLAAFAIVNVLSR